MKFRDEYICPLEFVHDALKGKWKPVIMYQINYRGSASLSELKKDIMGISQKMLIQSLQELRECGFLDKENSDGYPLRVKYYLTDIGRRIIDALEIFQEVGKMYLSTPFSVRQDIERSKPDTER